jgi:uncharacterized membrane protein YhaH (DUF805 family)
MFELLNLFDAGIVPIQSDGGGIASLLFIVFFLAVVVAQIAGLWLTFSKARQPGWAAIVPIYNTYIMLKVAGRPGWWLLLYVIPIVSLYPAIQVPIDIAKSFGKGTGFGLGLVFLPFVFFPLLGFSDAQYQGPAA